MADLEAIFERHRLINRTRYLLLRMPFETRRARLRGFWHGILRWYESELCLACGRPVMRSTGSWWYADDALWLEVVGQPYGVLCPPCFTARCDSLGMLVCWTPVVDSRQPATSEEQK